MTKNVVPPLGRKARIALGAIVAPPLATLALIQLLPPSSVIYGPKEIILFLVAAYVLTGMQGFSLALILEYGLQPRLGSHLGVLAAGALTGAACGVAFPLVWLDSSFAARCALAGGIAGIGTATMVRWHWVRAAAKHDVAFQAVPLVRPRPSRLPLLVSIGAIAVSIVLLSLVFFVWLAAG